MEPAYHSGDRVLVDRVTFRLRPPRPGDVVVLRDREQRDRFLLKRVAGPPEGTPPGGLWVLGDNAAESRDSRAFGPVRRRDIVGRAWLKY